MILIGLSVNKKKVKIKLGARLFSLSIIAIVKFVFVVVIPF